MEDVVMALREIAMELRALNVKMYDMRVAVDKQTQVMVKMVEVIEEGV